MMLRSRAGCILATLLTLAACGRDRSGAEAAVKEALKDPESARFGEFYFNSKTGKACLETNAKNSMGGYTGDKQVQLVKNGSGWEYIGETEETADECRKTHADETRDPQQVLDDRLKNLE